MKKILNKLIILLLAFCVVGCGGKDESSDSNKVNIKDVSDFSESKGMVNYFTIDDYKISIPETVGEYENYLKQIGDVTLGDTGKSSFDETIEANGVSSMVQYLSVITEDDEEHRFIVRYENTSDEEISVAEAKVTYIEIKYDALSEQSYDRAIDSIVIYANGEEIPMRTKTKMEDVGEVCGLPEQNTDGRLRYTDDEGYEYIFDCSTEMRKGVFRGLIIKYPGSI